MPGPEKKFVNANRKSLSVAAFPNKFGDRSYALTRSRKNDETGAYDDVTIWLRCDEQVDEIDVVISLLMKAKDYERARASGTPAQTKMVRTEEDGRVVVQPPRIHTMPEDDDIPF